MWTIMVLDKQLFKMLLALIPMTNSLEKYLSQNCNKTQVLHQELIMINKIQHSKDLSNIQIWMQQWDISSSTSKIIPKKHWWKTRILWVKVFRWYPNHQTLSRSAEWATKLILGQEVKALSLSKYARVHIPFQVQETPKLNDKYYFIKIIT